MQAQIIFHFIGTLNVMDLVQYILSLSLHLILLISRPSLFFHCLMYLLEKSGYFLINNIYSFALTKTRMKVLFCN